MSCRNRVAAVRELSLLLSLLPALHAGCCPWTDPTSQGLYMARPHALAQCSTQGYVIWLEGCPLFCNLAAGEWWQHWKIELSAYLVNMQIITNLQFGELQKLWSEKPSFLKFCGRQQRELENLGSVQELPEMDKISTNCHRFKRVGWHDQT